jgi:hypothetical protein
MITHDTEKSGGRLTALSEKHCNAINRERARMGLPALKARELLELQLVKPVDRP